MGAENVLVEEVLLLPLDGVPLGLGEAIAARLSRRLHAACRIVEAAQHAPATARLPERDQLDADALLAWLLTRASDASAVLVGLTSRDIAIPIFTFVFGRARLGSRAVLVSLARLDPAFYGLPLEPNLTIRRATDEILHELGHAASLQHCRDASCLMAFAGSVEKVDARGSAFCGRCQERLPSWLKSR
jgi:archaemetzincin